MLSAMEWSEGVAAGQARMECFEITGSADGISGGKEYTPWNTLVLGQFEKEEARSQGYFRIPRLASVRDGLADHPEAQAGLWTLARFSVPI